MLVHRVFLGLTFRASILFPSGREPLRWFSFLSPRQLRVIAIRPFAEGLPPLFLLLFAGEHVKFAPGAAF